MVLDNSYLVILAQPGRASKGGLTEYDGVDQSTLQCRNLKIDPTAADTATTADDHHFTADQRVRNE